jgi:beta-lactamase class A
LVITTAFVDTDDDSNQNKHLFSTPDRLDSELMMDRRTFTLRGGLAALALGFTRTSNAARIRLFEGLPASLEALEKTNACRLGVSVFDTSSGEQNGYRAGERFAMCSTFKMLLAASVLQRVDRGQEQLDRSVPIPASSLVPFSPITEPHAGGALAISAMCRAIITRSDNTAANLLLETIGGPAGLTAFARTLGDKMTRLDRTETSLNEATPGDPRDTTAPTSMTDNLHRLLLGDTLSKSTRDLLTQWMISNTYGDTRLRSNLPKGWRAGDKTGANGTTTTNDIAIYWPLGDAPVLVSAYLTECPGSDAKRNAILASVGQLIVVAVQARTQAS